MVVLTQHFCIERTWSGELIPPKACVRIDLLIDTTGAHVKIDSPFYDDVPPQEPPGSTWALWEYEVVELFLVDESGSYLELEFGPHGHFLALRLVAPREMASTHLKLDYRSQIAGNRWLVKRLLHPNTYQITSAAGMRSQYRGPVQRVNISLGHVYQAFRQLSSASAFSKRLNLPQGVSVDCFNLRSCLFE